MVPPVVISLAALSQGGCLVIKMPKGMPSNSTLKKRAYNGPSAPFWEHRHSTVKGSGRGYNINNTNQPWGRKGTLPYTLACTVKSRPSPTSNLTSKREEKGRERCLFAAQAGLASYLCRLSTLRVYLSVLGGGIHPHHSMSDDGPSSCGVAAVWKPCLASVDNPGD